MNGTQKAHGLEQDQSFMQVALDEAMDGLREGGIPVGACLVVDGRVVAKGRNRLVQSGSILLHGETDCLQNAGYQRLTPAEYKRGTLYTTLSPCHMCTGTILLLGIPRVVMAENTTFHGPEELLARYGVEVTNLQRPDAIAMVRGFSQAHPELWYGGMGFEIPR